MALASLASNNMANTTCIDCKASCPAGEQLHGRCLAMIDLTVCHACEAGKFKSHSGLWMRARRASSLTAVMGGDEGYVMLSVCVCECVCACPSPKLAETNLFAAWPRPLP